jgi:hypothetical protein
MTENTAESSAAITGPKVTTLDGPFRLPAAWKGRCGGTRDPLEHAAEDQ